VDRVRKVDYLHTHAGEICFKLVSLWSSPPVIALENPIELQNLPGVELVRKCLGMNFVDKPHVPHYLQSLRERNDRLLTLCEEAHLIAHYPSDEIVTMISCMTQNV
jgi:hypothetical protein